LAVDKCFCKRLFQCIFKHKNILKIIIIIIINKIENGNSSCGRLALSKYQMLRGENIEYDNQWDHVKEMILGCLIIGALTFFTPLESDWVIGIFGSKF
jgi:hypothetical protein